METRRWIRWAALNGVPRAFLRLRAGRGEPFSQILVGESGHIDPYRFADQIRQQGRLVRTPYSWVSADHALSRTILRDKRFGSTTPETMELPRVMGPLIRATDLGLPSPAEPPSMLMVDPPEHTRLRHTVSRAFTPRAIAKLRDRVEDVTETVLDKFSSKPTADLIADFAARLPLAIIAEMLGIPDDVRPRLLTWGNSGAALLDIGIPWRQYRAAVDSLAEADITIGEHIDELRRDPGDNILSDLAVNSDLTDHELKATAMLLAGAGFETTVNLIGNGVVLLLNHPDQLAHLRSVPDLWPNAIEEVLRYDSPVQLTARTALEDIDIAGTTIRAGRTVALLLGGANRDPSVFTDPDSFDVGRTNAKEHLSFSSGVHSCLGASLARLEGTYALRALFDRYPDLQLADAPRRRELVTLRGYEKIPLALGDARAISA